MVLACRDPCHCTASGERPRRSTDGQVCHRSRAGLVWETAITRRLGLELPIFVQNALILPWMLRENDAWSDREFREFSCAAGWRWDNSAIVSSLIAEVDECRE